MNPNNEEQTQSVKNPHDAAFRSTFQDLEEAIAFLRAYLPKSILRHIDFTRMEIFPGSYVDEKMKDRHSDIVYKTRIKGKTAFLYILFEHQSTPDPLMPFRIICYMVNLWKGYAANRKNIKKLPIVLPLVLYHGTDKWNAPLNFRGMFEAHEDFTLFIPEFTYQLYDLSDYPDEMLILGNSMALAAVLYLFKHIFDEDFHEHATRALQLLAHIGDRPKMLRFLEILLRYIYNARNEDKEKVRKYIDTGLQHFDDEQAWEVAMTVADQLRQEGMEKGMEKGMKKGMKETTLKTSGILVKLINRRFGKVSPMLKQKLMNADIDILDQFGESIFDFEDLEDAEAWWEMKTPKKG